MEHVEERALSTAPHSPKWWYRYVDDSHVCLTREHLTEFHSHLNSINQHIKFTFAYPIHDLAHRAFDWNGFCPYCWAQHVAPVWQPCCDVLRRRLNVVGSNLTILKIEPFFKTPNMSQHVATGWPNGCNMLRPTMLRYVALECCDRLTGPYRVNSKRQHRILVHPYRCRGNLKICIFLRPIYFFLLSWGVSLSDFSLLLHSFATGKSSRL